jgi:putative selenate reductase
MPLDKLLEIILSQYENRKSIFGITEEMFFNPVQKHNLKRKLYGKTIDSPIGVAAGPQTQLSQNIVAAWLCGARFIELKTVQTLDELDVSKPCIDMQDEGYNCEWSQELKIHQSFEQYLDAWILIHVLSDKLVWNSSDIGTIFNMSVGYDLKGILSKNVQWFLDKMRDASLELDYKIKSIENIYPNINNININPCISDNITLSTMHGCPADEIETIGEYLIEKRKLHTSVKLNPTLLGKEKLLNIISNSGFETQVPDIAFDHDLKYEDAKKIITNLKKKSEDNNLSFGLKLTNTLESRNHKEVFPENEQMMYMSGKALHPISINLAAKLQNDFDGKLNISFSGGADAFNIGEIIKCGLSPVTVCSDLLKPGGYGRLKQYIDNLIDISSPSVSASLKALNKYAIEVMSSRAYKKSGLHDPNIKTTRALGRFDCIHAPCVDSCPTNQGIPDYLYFSSKGEFKKAAEIILKTNPFPYSTGMVCDHLCQTKCTRINYDSPVLIREVKRYIAQNFIKKQDYQINSKTIKFKVSIIGAGPSGLSCAYFLAKEGFKLKVYESKTKAGGMIQGAIPSFRLSNEAIGTDIESIIDLGVEVAYETKINKHLFSNLQKESDFIYISTGAKKSKIPKLSGIKNKGVLDPLDFLFDIKENKNTFIGKNVVIIGGGNTAMDAARTAYRMVGKNGKVTIVYRRTIRQMPADVGEIEAVLDEGIKILELASPHEIISEHGKIKSLVCQKMRLGEKDSSGRAKPIEIPESFFELSADTLIPAIGQEIDIDFATKEELLTKKGEYETKIPNVFIGGDALRGASTAINAIGDGRKAAMEIIEKAGIKKLTTNDLSKKKIDLSQLTIAKSTRIAAQNLRETSLTDRMNFNLVNSTLSKEEVIKEASRCLLCDEVCNVCATVCPNLAFHSYQLDPITYKLQRLSEKGIENNHPDVFSVKQKYQIIHLADWCNECGNCNTFCPTADAPYVEKPHLYFDKEVFEKEKDGFYYEKKGESGYLYAFFNKHLHKLTRKGENFFFENKNVFVELDAMDMHIIDYKLLTKSKFEQDMKIPAEMRILMLAAESFYCNLQEIKSKN